MYTTMKLTKEDIELIKWGLTKVTLQAKSEKTREQAERLWNRIYKKGIALDKKAEG